MHCERFEAMGEELRGVDMIHWWIGGNFNPALFAHAQSLHSRGLLSPTAEAVVLFDLRWGMDVVSWKALEPRASWTKRVDFDECDACLARHPRETWNRYVTCRRAVGTILIAGFQMSEVSATVAALSNSVLATVRQADGTALIPPDNYKSSPCV